MSQQATIEKPKQQVDDVVGRVLDRTYRCDQPGCTAAAAVQCASQQTGCSVYFCMHHLRENLAPLREQGFRLTGEDGRLLPDDRIRL